MTILTPEYLQTKTYSAKRDRRLQQAEVMQEGIVDFGHFKVAQRGAGANMSVDVGAGEAWVKGDTSVEQGMYHVVNDATVNVAISAASAVNPRIDTLVLAVNDSTEIGGSDEFKLEVLAGTVSAGATLANLTGVAAVGNTKLVLAYILVGKEVTSITTEKIGGKRDYRAGLTGYPAVAEPKAVTGAPPQYAHGRPLSYVPGVAATRAVEASFATGAAITFPTEEWDNEEIHSTSVNTDRLTIVTPGLYKISFSTQITVGGTPFTMYVKLNGVAAAYAVQNIPTGGLQASTSVDLRLGFGDFVQGIAEFATSPKNVAGSRLTAIWQGP